MSGFTTTATLAEMINKRSMRKRRRRSGKKKKKKKSSKRSARASLIKSMSALYKSGARIPASMFRARRK